MNSVLYAIYLHYFPRAFKRIVKLLKWLVNMFNKGHSKLCSSISKSQLNMVITISQLWSLFATQLAY